MHHVRQLTIGFLLLATIFGGVWVFRNSTDSVYSISKPSPARGEETPPATVDEVGPGDAAGSGTADDASPSPSVSASPSPTRAAVKPRPPVATPATTKAVPKRAPARAPAPTAKPTGDQATKLRVVELVNAERAKAGCGAVHTDTRLDNASQGHSADMARRNYFSHTTPEGVDPWERARAAGYTTPTGENIAMGQRTAEQVMDSWMNSSGHRANILNCDSHAIGMGLARNAEGSIYWTQMFGSV